MLLALVGAGLGAQILIPIMGVVVGGGAVPGVWTQIQSKWGPVTSSGTTLSVTLNSVPIVGNLVVCGIMAYPYSKTTSSITDNAGTPNTYTVTPSSPSTVSPSSTYAAEAYLVVPTSGAGSTITVNLAAAITTGSAMGCEEFNLAAGTPGFDKDAAGHGNPGTTPNTPSITPSAAGELLVGVAYIGNGGTGAGSPWTLWPPGLMANGGQTTGCGSTAVCVFGDELILSSTATATALSFTGPGTGYWNSMIAAFN